MMDVCQIAFCFFSSLAKVNTFQRKMAAVGAPGPEISDEPHIPSVTIVHRYFSPSQEYLAITGVDDSMTVRWKRRVAKKEISLMWSTNTCLCKIGLIFVLGTPCIPGGIIPLVCDVILWLNAIRSHSPLLHFLFLSKLNITTVSLSAHSKCGNVARTHG